MPCIRHYFTLVTSLFMPTAVIVLHLLLSFPFFHPWTSHSMCGRRHVCFTSKYRSRLGSFKIKFRLVTACRDPGAEGEGRIGDFIGNLVFTFVSKVLAKLSNPFLKYHQCGGLLKVCVYHDNVCCGEVYIYIYRRLACEYWIIVSKLFNNKFIVDQPIQDGWTIWRHLLCLTLSTASVGVRGCSIRALEVRLHTDDWCRAKIYFRQNVVSGTEIKFCMSVQNILRFSVTHYVLPTCSSDSEEEQLITMTMQPNHQVSGFN